MVFVSGCSTDGSCVKILPYDRARDNLKQVASNDTSRKFWMPSRSTTYGMYSVVDEVGWDVGGR